MPARCSIGPSIAASTASSSPCDRVKVGDLVSRRKQPRQRLLSDDELRCLWKATGRLGYPWRQLFRLLLLTGVRKTEAAGARWCEFDFNRKVWSVPPERFKSNATHLVALSADALAVLAELPRFKHGDHVFSFTFGERAALVLHQGQTAAGCIDAALSASPGAAAR